MCYTLAEANDSTLRIICCHLVTGIYFKKHYSLITFFLSGEKDFNQSKTIFLVKTIHSTSRGHNIICLGIPLFLTMAIILGKNLGNFHFKLR